MRIPNVSTKSHFTVLCCTAVALLASPAHAVSSAELYTSDSYPYGRFEARVQYAGGDGIVGSFFLWKDASEMSDVFWNELDLETVWSDCEIFSNALYGLPEANHTQSHGSGTWCTGFHTYAYEWTADYVAWFIDGAEVRRETGADSTAFRDNADAMQIHFNVWPGDSTFGGNFSPSILPLFEYINWVQYSSYANGEFTLEWREDFGGDSLPEGWLTGDWGSPKGLSTHSPDNVAFIDGYAVLSMTADDATGSAGASPMDPEGGGPIMEPEPDEPVDDPPVPDETAPDETAPDETAPDETAPDETAPDETTPDETTPDETGALPGDDTAAPIDSEPVPDTGGAMDPPSDPGAGGGDVDVPPTDSTGETTGVTTGVDVTESPGADTGGGTPPQPGNTGGQQTPSGTETAAPVEGAVSGAPAGSGTPSGTATTTPQAGVPGAPLAADTAPAATESQGGSDGGCHMSGDAASSRWAWVALLLGVCASWVRRRRARA